MNGCKVGHHHTKRLGPIYSAENFAANSIQFIGYLVRQWEYERGVDALKWNVQPRAVIERNKMCLRGLGFEIHDDVFGEGVLSADFEHSEKLAEMALGEFGIDGEPELGARLHGSNDSALRSGSGFLRSGHVVSSFGYILQYMYMLSEDHTPIVCAQRSSLERCAKGKLWIHCTERGSRMNRKKLTVGEEGRKGGRPGTRAAVIGYSKAGMNASPVMVCGVGQVGDATLI